MAEDKEKSSPGQDAAVADRIEKLETLVRQNEVLRKQTRTWSWVGVLLILVLLLVFVFRIYNHFDTEYVQPIKNNPEQFLKAFAAETNLEPRIRQEAQLAVHQLREEVLKDFSKTFYEELQERMPEIEEKAMEMGGNLTDYAKEHLAQKLNDALADSLEQAFKEIEEAYPTLKEADLEGDMDKAKEMFVEQLTDVIEERYARVDSSLEGLKSAVNRVKTSAGSEQLPAMQQGEVAELLIDALVDVIVYELKPEMGAEPVAQ